MIGPTPPSHLHRVGVGFLTSREYLPWRYSIGLDKLFQQGTIYILFRIFQPDHLYSRALFQHILEYMKGDSPLEGLWSSEKSHKIGGKSRKIEANRTKSLEKWTLAARRSSYCVI